jgi:hypothetical protein
MPVAGSGEQRIGAREHGHLDLSIPGAADDISVRLACRTGTPARLQKIAERSARALKRRG